MSTISSSRCDVGIHITSDLTWSMNTAHLVKKAQQRLFFLRKLKRAGLSPQLLDKLLQGHNREHPLSSYKRHLSTTSNSQTPNSTMAKTKELSKDTRNKIVDLHQAGKTESAIGVRQPYSNVQSACTNTHTLAQARALLGRLQLLRTPDWRSAARPDRGQEEAVCVEAEEGQTGRTASQAKG
ncbi:hypothetical protein L3Q82_021911 [Scortum barcoo]|uniref:Uncharacterized protein n=1 Tax=Scortum barcoo TaxID=214431 RepID=A0ACB8X575_9TELE|nr:hypothetical protein L3Q82_021911 [Scortum barcoo]